MCRCPWEAVIQSGAGAEQEGRALLLRARRSEFRFQPSPRATRTHPRWMQGGGRVRPDPVEIDAEAHEQVVERVAAIDVAKASGMVCTRVPPQAHPGQRSTKVWQVPASSNAILELAEQLVAQGIERVVVESTSDYWRPWFYLLEARGLRVGLGNARGRTHPPGRPH